MHVRMSVCQRFSLHSPSGNASRLPPERLTLDRQESLAPVSCGLNINDVCTIKNFCVWTYLLWCGVQGILPGEDQKKIWKESD
jgi:hypothetical protein